MAAGGSGLSIRCKVGREARRTSWFDFEMENVAVLQVWIGEWLLEVDHSIEYRSLRFYSITQHPPPSPTLFPASSATSLFYFILLFPPTSYPAAQMGSSFHFLGSKLSGGGGTLISPSIWDFGGCFDGGFMNGWMGGENGAGDNVHRT